MNSHRFRSILCLLPIFAILGHAQTPGPDMPLQINNSYSLLAKEEGCAVVIGGSLGNSFTEPLVAKFWHAVNDEITGHLHAQLLHARYRVVRLTIDVENASKLSGLVAQALSQHQCNRAIQLTTDVNEDSQGKYFAFEIDQLRFVPKSSIIQVDARATAVREYSRNYRFPRTQQSFDSFHTGTFAQTVFVDLKSTGFLEPIRQNSP